MGLPLVQLKEHRRDLVVALQNRKARSGWELMQICGSNRRSPLRRGIADLDAGEAENEAAA